MLPHAHCVAENEVCRCAYKRLPHLYLRVVGSRASLGGIREEEEAPPGLGLSPLRRASSGSAPAGAASPQRTTSGGLVRGGSLKRELCIPQVEAAQSL